MLCRQKTTFGTLEWISLHADEGLDLAMRYFLRTPRWATHHVLIPYTSSTCALVRLHYLPLSGEYVLKYDFLVRRMVFEMLFLLSCIAILKAPTDYWLRNVRRGMVSMEVIIKQSLLICERGGTKMFTLSFCRNRRRLHLIYQNFYIGWFFGLCVAYRGDVLYSTTNTH